MYKNLLSRAWLAVTRYDGVITVKYSTKSTSTKFSSKKVVTQKSFQETLPLFLEPLASSQKFSKFPQLKTHIEKLVKYNTSDGPSGGLATLNAYKMMERTELINEDSMRLASLMGWFVEIWHAFAYLADDLVDDSPVRHGLTTWHRLPEVGPARAFNDAIFMLGLLMESLDIHFSHLSQFNEIKEIFIQSFIYTSAGQKIDLLMTQNKDYTLFTMEHYMNLVEYKTTHMGYKLPLLLSYSLTSHYQKEHSHDVKGILNDIATALGKLFQLVNDYNDVFGNETSVKKAVDCEDIIQGKLTWLSVVALQHCNSEQRKLFLNNYGISEENCVEKIKQLYVQLELPYLCEKEEASQYAHLVAKVDTLSGLIPSEAFLHVIYKTFDYLHVAKTTPHKV